MEDECLYVNLMLSLLRVLAFAVIPLTVASPAGLQGVVACFEPDSGFGLETRMEEGCFCPSADRDAGGPALSSADAGCADCICLPLSSDRKPFLANSTRDDRPGESLLHSSSPTRFEPRIPAAPTGKVFPLRDFQSPIPFFRLTLRTIVLLT